MRFGPPDVNNFDYVKEKKNDGLMLRDHEGELCGRELDPQGFSGNGLFSKPLTGTTHYPQRKKNPVGQKCIGNERSWVEQPKFRNFGGLCTAHRCGIHWSEIDMLQAYNNGAGAATTISPFRPHV